MLRKYATVTVLDAYVAGEQTQVQKVGHRAIFDYIPREGHLYVRSRIISSRCNDNHDEFPAEEIRQGYKSLVGKPVFVNHNNNDHRRMRGVIIDAVLHEDTAPDGRPDTWVEGLHELDAQRFPKLAAAIISGRISRTSMGTDVGFSVCSACNNKASTPAEYCQHIPRMKGQILYRHTASGKREGEVIREICHKLSFFENSFLVEPPADPTAYVLGVDTRGLNKAASLQKEAIPEGMKFHFAPANVHPSGEHYIRATMPGEGSTRKDVGSLKWSPHNGMVSMIEANHHYRHQGIGTALWQRAHEIANEHGLTPPRHSDVRTDDGYGWSQNVDKQPLPLPAPGQQSLFGRDLAETTDTSLPGPVHDDVREHLQHEHGMDMRGLNPAMNFDVVHDTWHNIRQMRKFHVHGGLRTLAQVTALHQGEPFRIQPKNGKWLVVDVKGKTRGEHATEQDAKVHQATLYSSLPQAGDVSGNQNPKSTPDTATEIVRARMGAYQVPANCLNCGVDMVKPRHAGDERAHENSPVCSDCLDGEVIDPKEKPPSIYHQETDSGGRRMTRDLIKDVGQGRGRHFGPEHMMPQSYSSLPSVVAEDKHFIESSNCLNCNRPMMIGKSLKGVMPFKKDESGLCYDCARGHTNQRKPKPAPELYIDAPGRGGRGEADHLMQSVDEGRGRHWTPDDYVRQSQNSLLSLRNVEAAAHKYPDPADHPFFKKYPVSTENVVASFKKADEGRKAQGMRWYSDAHLLAKALTPEDPGKAAGVLAAYSPKAAWPDNMFNAARSLHEGRALGLGEGASIMGQHQRTAQKIMDGEHHSKVMKSPKIGDFAHLIEHGDDSEDEKEIGKSRVVVDRHAMSVATGKRMTTKDLEEAPLHSRHYYEHVADTYRKAATQLSQELGEKIAPHQVQAVTWGVQQEQNQKDDEESGAGGAKGRSTRTKNSWNNWAEHAKGQHPDLHGDPPNLHAGNPYEASLKTSLPFVLAYGEVKAPAEVDTLRTESCPVCGESDSFDGDRCEVCHFLQPPSMFTDPDTGVAKQMDLKKEPFDQGMVGPNGEPLPDVDSQEEQQEMAGMPGTPGDQVADLFCPACGFSADTQEPMTNNDPALPSGEQGLMEGDLCPQCEQATMLSPNDVGEMGGEVPQEIAGDADADAMPDDQEPDVDKDGIPDDAEPDVDADGIPDDAEPDEDQDGVPDDAEEAPSGPGEVPGEEDADPAAVEDEEPPQKGRKDNSRRASWRGHERDTMTKPNQTAGASSELATLRRTVAVQQEQLAVAGRQLHYLAQLAGVAGEFDAIKRQGAQKIADIMNPAQPIPDPPGGAPTETTQQAEAPETFDDPRNPGLTPGSTNGVPAAMTASPLDPGVTMPTSPYTQLVDPTQPVAGTETHVPLDQTKIETDVRVGDPMANVDNPQGYGFPLTGPFAADGAASANTTTSPGMQSNPGRTMASIRLAKLRKSAGLVSADVDEMVLGSQIERTAALTDAMIVHEIGTLDSVVKAAARVQAGRRPQGGPLPKTAGAERRAPSLAGDMGMSVQASAVSGFDDGDASDLFMNSLSG